MTTRRWLLFATVLVVGGLAVAFVFLAAGIANQVEAAVSALAGVAAIGTGVWAALDPTTSTPEKADAPFVQPSQLPRDLIDFTGRSEEVRRLSRALTTTTRHANAVLITTIAGQGGVGKTVLAVHVAHLVAHVFPQGQIYVNLRGPEAEALEPFTVLGSLLRELGVPPDALPKTLEERSRLFRSVLGNRRTLIVLDNAQSESQVAPLLPGESTSVVLITSRSRLAALDGTTVIRLDVLDRNEALALLRNIVGNARVDRELKAAEELVELSSLLPLAIRILGARLAYNPHWTLAQTVERFKRQSSLLSGFEDGNRAVRSSFEISYVNLTPEARQLFASLGALTIRSFPDWLFASLDPVHESPAGSARDELLRNEMLETSGTDGTGTERYSYHDLLRDFSREKLPLINAAGEDLRITTIRLATQAYLSICRAGDIQIRRRAPRHNVFPGYSPGEETVQEPLFVPSDYAIAIRWFETELSNVLLIMAQALVEKFYNEVTALAYFLSAFCEEKSYWREWESAVRMGLEAARAQDSPEIPLMLFQVGRSHHLLGQWVNASQEFQDARDLAVNRGDTSVEAASICALGKIHQLGDIDLALPLLEDSRRLYLEIGDSHSWAYVTANIADIYHQKKVYDRSMAEFDACLSVFAEKEDTWWEANAGIWIGDVLKGQGDFKAAVARLQKSYRSMIDLGDERRAAVALVNLARTQAEAGDGRRALQALGEAFPVLERVGDRWWTAMGLIERGKAQWLLGRPAEALAAWNAALPVVQERGNREVLADLIPRVEEARRKLNSQSQGKDGTSTAVST